MRGQRVVDLAAQGVMTSDPLLSLAPSSRPLALILVSATSGSCERPVRTCSISLTPTPLMSMAVVVVDSDPLTVMPAQPRPKGRSHRRQTGAGHHRFAAGENATDARHDRRSHDDADIGQVVCQLGQRFEAGCTDTGVGRYPAFDTCSL